MLLSVQPHNPHLHQAVKHGFDYLHNVMWDATYGGWYHRLTRAGEPLEMETKHCHGFAYALSACAAVYRVTKDSKALDLGLRAFDWIDRCARDAQYGGYFGFLSRDGRVVHNRHDLNWPDDVDGIQTPIGMKDANVHTDMLLGLMDMYDETGNDRIGARIEEVVHILLSKIRSPEGALHFLCRPDWTPVAHLIRYGYHLQGGSRLIRAGRLLDRLSNVLPAVEAMVGHCLRDAWDSERGGFYYAAPITRPFILENRDLMVRTKAWWVQFEGLKCLLTLAAECPDQPEYRTYALALWRYIKKNLMDHRHSGFYPVGRDSMHPVKRAIGYAPTLMTKGSVWKDSMHDGQALLYWNHLLASGDSSVPAANR